jgi:hypothetical protein
LLNFSVLSISKKCGSKARVPFLTHHHGPTTQLEYKAKNQGPGAAIRPSALFPLDGAYLNCTYVPKEKLCVWLCGLEKIVISLHYAVSKYIERRELKVEQGKLEFFRIKSGDFLVTY